MRWPWRRKRKVTSAGYRVTDASDFIQILEPYPSQFATLLQKLPVAKAEAKIDWLEDAFFPRFVERFCAFDEIQWEDDWELWSDHRDAALAAFK